MMLRMKSTSKATPLPTLLQVSMDTLMYALTLHFLSYAENMVISIGVDSTTIPNPHKLCDAIEESLTAMKVDVLNNAHAIFNNNYKKKFTLEHTWRELRHDQKWCGNESSNKRRKFDDGSHSASESVKDNDAEVDDGTNRPPGVKAAKARGKKRPMVEKSEFQTMCTIKQEDLAVKERLGKMKLLDSLIAKQEPLADEEEAHS
ncbi:hypothetical protein F2Q70_00032076 [Brassica cretica]|uniref:O-acyltransferase WSD1 C-terminal domain-containing protein n=1 Tax=Brassica cretica TaxID=69181 RepID=A0A8S9FCJ7_BRACR|nr:hypothetical protein F2Q70_00032076 [Brassica cretica]